MRKIEIAMDGNEWCVLWGDNLQEGVSGFGKHISEALWEFTKDFLEKFMDADKYFTPNEWVEMYDLLSNNYDEEFEHEIKDWNKTQEQYYKLKDL